MWIRLQPKRLPEFVQGWGKKHPFQSWVRKQSRGPCREPLFILRQEDYKSSHDFLQILPVKVRLFMAVHAMKKLRGKVRLLDTIYNFQHVCFRKLWNCNNEIVSGVQHLDGCLSSWHWCNFTSDIDDKRISWIMHMEEGASLTNWYWIPQQFQ